MPPNKKSFNAEIDSGIRDRSMLMVKDDSHTRTRNVKEGVCDQAWYGDGMKKRSKFLF